jgi:hypothetical protein
MGIGDKLVVCAAIRQIESAGFFVSAQRNDSDAEIFDLCGINHIQNTRDWRVIPWTDHVMAVPFGMGQDDMALVDSESSHPVERALWSIGLDRYAKPSPTFSIKHRGKKKAATIAWSPIEVSRAPCGITPQEWEPILSGMMNPQTTVDLWCATSDQPKAFDLIRDFSPTVAKRIRIRSASSFGRWADGMASCETVLAANTGGLWVGIGIGSTVTVVQHPATFPHAAMWQARAWPGVSVVEIPDNGARRLPVEPWRVSSPSSA